MQVEFRSHFSGDKSASYGPGYTVIVELAFSQVTEYTEGAKKMYTHFT